MQFKLSVRAIAIPQFGAFDGNPLPIWGGEEEGEGRVKNCHTNFCHTNIRHTNFGH